MKLDGKSRKTEIGIILAFFILCAVVLWQCRTALVAAHAASGGAQYNAAFVPQLLVGLLIILGLAQLVLTLLGRGGDKSEDELPEGELSGGELEEVEEIEALAASAPEKALALRAGLCVLWLAGFIMAMPVLGYYLTMPVFLMLTYVTLDARHPLIVLGLSIGFTLLTGYVFGGLLNVVLPVGIFQIAIW